MIGIRGATTVAEDTPEAIEKAAVEMMEEIMTRNNLISDKIVSVLFSATDDVKSAYPVKFIREKMDLRDAAILHFQEMEVVGSLRLCIRVLIHYDGSMKPQHVYLNEARKLRPDLSS